MSSVPDSLVLVLGVSKTTSQSPTPVALFRFDIENEPSEVIFKGIINVSLYEDDEDVTESSLESSGDEVLDEDEEKGEGHDSYVGLRHLSQIFTTFTPRTPMKLLFWNSSHDEIIVNVANLRPLTWTDSRNINLNKYLITLLDLLPGYAGDTQRKLVVRAMAEEIREINKKTRAQSRVSVHIESEPRDAVSLGSDEDIAKPTFWSKLNAKFLRPLTPQDVLRMQALQSSLLDYTHHTHLMKRLARPWTLLLFVMLVVDIFCVPARIAFGFDNRGVDRGTTFIVLAALADIALCLEVFRRLLGRSHGYHMHRDMQMSTIFVLILSLIPLDWIALAWSTLTVGWFRVNKLLRVPMMVTNCAYVLEILSERATGISRPAIWKLALLLFTYLTLAHILACVWFYTSATSPTANTLSWASKVGLVNPSTSWFRRELLSYYWAAESMVTVGFGDIIAVTTRETVVSIITMICGVMMSAAVISALTNLAIASDAAEAAHASHMVELDRYMRLRDVPSDLQERVRIYFAYHYAQTRGVDEQQLLIGLPERLRQAVLGGQSIRKQLEAVTTFSKAKGCQESARFFTELVAAGERQIAAPNCVLLSLGSQVKDFVLILHGTAMKQRPAAGKGSRGEVLKLLNEGDYYGHFGVCGGVEKAVGFEIRSRGFVEMLVISRASFDSVARAILSSKERDDFAYDVKRQAEQQAKLAKMLGGDDMAASGGLEAFVQYKPRKFLDTVLNTSRFRMVWAVFHLLVVMTNGIVSPLLIKASGYEAIEIPGHDAVAFGINLFAFCVYFPHLVMRLLVFDFVDQHTGVRINNWKTLSRSYILGTSFVFVVDAVSAMPFGLFWEHTLVVAICLNFKLLNLPQYLTRVEARVSGSGGGFSGPIKRMIRLLCGLVRDDDNDR
ncbi:MAG: hypothetical protein MHM6MM_005444 [Cercozoa sp. M6MM]